jgi:hypothetical protein
MKDLKCSSCGLGISGENFVRFNCPACGKEEIVRCFVCRKNVRTYLCKCGFEGP